MDGNANWVCGLVPIDVEEYRGRWQGGNPKISLEKDTSAVLKTPSFHTRASSKTEELNFHRQTVEV